MIIHTRVIKEFGGADGIRDRGLVDATISRPFQTFDGQELYPSAIEKAAAVIESVLNNHPFVDGNKRTGYVLLRLILLNNNLDITATQAEKYDFVIRIANGTDKFEQIKSWLEKNVTANS